MCPNYCGLGLVPVQCVLGLLHALVDLVGVFAELLLGLVAGLLETLLDLVLVRAELLFGLVEE
ncbi:hypothetical protein [Smaragdicoccus niigatensis]|uniref:hypothetical protein n=1 Tax=Smaragdicoccus niigatensis TaxID=359359 RepID=UPI001FE0CC19|nr:hypothetical protein [Smaragdicoccus niigatensis]